ncbi:hypothetical protein ACIQOU_30340 [Streptomyces sp. NPDC091279]|uniref:hypothetical protein n=1 Tax=unclassified Streptomyces TaxID=2593676 RepID=UPI003811B932
MAIKSVEVDFETVARLPGGRVVLTLEAPRNFTWQIVDGHMEWQAQTEMRDQMRDQIASRSWVQHWSDAPGRDPRNPSGAEGRTVTVEVLIVDELPDGKTVDKREVPGYFAWLILKGSITERARAEMEAQMQYLIDAGLWEQIWHGFDDLAP